MTPVLRSKTAVLLGVSLANLWYVYGGYARVMTLVARRAPAPVPRRLESSNDLVVVYLGLKDEEETIRPRLANLLDTDYPVDRLHVLCVLDGCADDTLGEIERFHSQHPELSLEIVDYPTSSGKWRTQNLAAERFPEAILISTDAETSFDRRTIPELVASFADPTVGVAAGLVTYEATSAIGKAYGDYREMEDRLREAESLAGVLNRCDAPCVAYRPAVWRPIEKFEDVDQVVCVLARLSGHRSVHVRTARAVDRANVSSGQDIRQRARMAKKTLLTYQHRWGRQEIVDDPYFTWALYSHKMTRFASPMWTVVVLLSGGATAQGLLGTARFLGAVTVGAGLVGGVPKLQGLAVSYLTAQAGFALGVYQYLSGNREGKYEPMRHSR